MYQNPIRAGICRKVEDYPYSTLSGLIGIQKAIVPMVEDTLLFSGNIEENLNWLNTLPPKEDQEAMSLGLRRGEFKLPCDQSQQPHKLEKNRL